MNWGYLVHGGDAGCGEEEGFRWEGGRGSVGAIEIRCRRCGARRRLSDAYRISWRCTGRRPELEPPDSPPVRRGCECNARMIQRQALNLRIPELRTVFTVPPANTALHRALRHRPVRDYLVARLRDAQELCGPLEFDGFRRAVENLRDRGRLPEATAEAILSAPQELVVAAVEDVLEDLLAPSPRSYDELLRKEMRALVRAARNGAHGSDASEFEVIPDRIRVIPVAGVRMRVVPVSRLRTLVVQLGYRSMVGGDHASATLVSVAWESPQGDRWCPGMEYLGEGLFLMLADGDGWHFGMKGGAAERWNTARARRDAYPDVVFRSESREELHPVFVWWHTLSHLIIRAIGRCSGYGSTAIRERIYLEEDGRRARGAVLLYSAQPGGEAALGGLVGIVPRFEAVLERALEGMLYCSNGHLCDEMVFRPGGHGGAACYGCAVVSETSCEHRNLWLDRSVLLENLP